MRKIFQSIIALFCAVVLCTGCTGALAEFSPRYQALTQGGGMTAELYASFETLEPLSPDSLAAVNDWLSRIRLTLSTEETAGRSAQRIDVAMDGDSLFSVLTQRREDYTLTTFSPSEKAYITGAGALDALSLMADGPVGIPPLNALPQGYAALAEKLYPLLAGRVTPKAAKSSTSIKNALASASYENYVFTGDEMNEAWPEILTILLPVLRDALSDQPAWYLRAEELLQSLEFSGECRFKRFLDKEGKDMGLQFTGRAGRDGDVRKVTLFGGHTPNKGGYVSLALPAASGKNNFKITLTGKLTEKNNQNTLNVEATYTRTYEGASSAATMEMALKNARKDGDEHWTGKATVTRTENKIKTTYTLTPDLSFTADGLQGQIALQAKTGSRVTVKGAVSVLLRPAAEGNAPDVTAAKDLRAMTDAQARAVVMDELTALTRAFSRLMAGLPEDARTLLTHEMRTDAWMTAPSVPVPAEGSLPQEDFTVTQDLDDEEDQTQPEEDQP